MLVCVRLEIRVQTYYVANWDFQDKTRDMTSNEFTRVSLLWLGFVRDRLRLRLYVSQVLVHAWFRSCCRPFSCLLLTNTYRWCLGRSRLSSLELCYMITFVDSWEPKLLKIMFVVSWTWLHDHVRRLSRSPAAVHVCCFSWWSRTGSSSHLGLLGHAGTWCTCTRGPHTFIWDTLMRHLDKTLCWDTVVRHRDKTFLWDILIRNCHRLWSTLMTCNGIWQFWLSLVTELNNWTFKFNS